jgi:hypothetical protein
MPLGVCLALYTPATVDSAMFPERQMTWLGENKGVNVEMPEMMPGRLR